jgi:hypothetical protein
MPPTQLGWAEISASHHSRKRRMSSCGMPPEPKQRHTPGGAIPSGRSSHDPAAREDIPGRVDQPQNAERHPQATGSNDLAHGDESCEDSPQRGSFAESGQFSGSDLPQDADRVLEQTNGAPCDSSDEGFALSLMLSQFRKAVVNWGCRAHHQLSHIHTPHRPRKVKRWTTRIGRRDPRIRFPHVTRISFSRKA